MKRSFPIIIGSWSNGGHFHEECWIVPAALIFPQNIIKQAQLFPIFKK